MKTTTSLTSLAAALLLAGCATAPEPEVRQGERLATISVASAPAGMVLELNDRYMGLTPQKIRVPVTDYGTWKGSSVYNLKCSSPDGQEVEVKTYYNGETPPSHVLFRMPRTIWRQQLLNNMFR